jgi:hypothetical protein
MCGPAPPTRAARREAASDRRQPQSSTTSIVAEAQFTPAVHAAISGLAIVGALLIGSAAVGASFTARTSVRPATEIPSLNGLSSAPP